MGEGHLAVALDVWIGADVDPVGGDHVLFAFLQVAQVNLAVAVGSDELWHRRRVAPQMVLVHQDLDVVGAGENLVALRTNFVIHQLFQGNDIRVDLLITWNNTAVPCRSIPLGLIIFFKSKGRKVIVPLLLVRLTGPLAYIYLQGEFREQGYYLSTPVYPVI